MIWHGGENFRVWKKTGLQGLQRIANPHLGACAVAILIYSYEPRKTFLVEDCLGMASEVTHLEK